jgi:hypothetical protein
VNEGVHWKSRPGYGVIRASKRGVIMQAIMIDDRSSPGIAGHAAARRGGDQRACVRGAPRAPVAGRIAAAGVPRPARAEF